MFNNAGVALSSTIEGMEYADLEWIVGINFWGVVHGTKAFLPYFKDFGRRSHRQYVESVFGLFSQPGMKRLQRDQVSRCVASPKRCARNST